MQAFFKLDAIASSQTEKLRKVTKMVQESRKNNDEESLKKAVEEFDHYLERYG